MSDNSKIEWTEATWNPITGCDEVSPGCDNCYAKTFAERWRGIPGHHFERGFDVVLRPERLDQPLKWRKPRRIFVNSMSDLFHDSVPDEFIAQVFSRMWHSPQHTFQVLTKRHGRMRSIMPRVEEQLRSIERDLALIGHPAPLTWPLPNVWLGVSVENQQWANIRIPALLDTPAAVRWLSCEPLLGPVDLTQLLTVPCTACGGVGEQWVTGSTPVPCHCAGGVERAINWVVCGGESGHRARPMRTEWARSLRDQCQAARVPFFLKQWGEHVSPEQMTEAAFTDWDAIHGSSAYDRGQPWRIGKRRAGRELDGQTWDQYPHVAEAVTR